MHALPARARSRSFASLLALASAAAAVGGCQRTTERPVLPRSQTWAELRTVRRAITVAPPGEKERAPYPRERLVDGEVVKVADEGLAWLRRDGGATLLVSGPAELTLRADDLELKRGKVFVDTPKGETAELTTPAGKLHLARVRASLSVDGQKTEAYVLAGEVRTDGSVHAGPGERLFVDGTKAHAEPALTWEDWTGGLATTERQAEPSPYGVGTVGARRPGDQGAPRFPLAIQKLDVKVTIDHDLAITEVDELFFNPSSEVVEGVYRFRTPEGATLHRFGVDKDGVVVWGRVKEKQAAAAQYQANVYQGSTEDPALLEWDAPGVYRARLYPIGPGDTRRVVVRYAEWLGRTGEKGERRLYVYPMAAEGSDESLPHIEELTARIDLANSGAKDVRVGMTGVREGDELVVRAHDLVPRADLAVELFDGGETTPRGYVAPHVVDVESLPAADRPEALRRARGEADYLLVPVRADDVPLAAGGLDLAIVVDTSAATEPASLAIARAATRALLAHMGKDDRAVVWAGDATLRPVVPGKDRLAPVDEAARRAILTGLATADRGGATDLGAMLTAAAKTLDPKRRGAVVYIGDGAPTVGELGLQDLRDRLAKLPRPVRIFGLGVGDGADMGILKGLSRGAIAERIGDANAAARAALRLLEEAERPAWLGASVDLGQDVERVFPRDLTAMIGGETVLVVGRMAQGAHPPQQITVTGPSGKRTLPLTVARLDDQGDLRRRWADGRLAQMLDQNEGRAAMVDLGVRNGIITPVTSLYVPTKNEMTADERADLERKALAQREQIVRGAEKAKQHRGSGFFS
ncbi:MAG TPA: VIT domain-containing protein, partial [Minicystis sp.]|nr:VIT domain-containing protein [Minicystis sp.]